MLFNRETFQSSGKTFIIYVGAASLLILVFRYFFPGEAAPLPVFSRSWRLIQGLLNIITLFPALVFSALVIPFGIAEKEERLEGFSSRLFQRMTSPIVSAICAAGIYALLLFLIFPLAWNYRENMRYRGEMYRMAQKQAEDHAKNEKWIEASQFIGICESVWQFSPELADLKADVDIHLKEAFFEANSGQAAPGVERPVTADISNLPGQREPVDVLDAIAMGEAALGEGQPLDAHWLATIGQRIAREGSPEKAAAERLAARAWNRIESQQPTVRETSARSLYERKLSGYQAMVSGDWIRAYYIFHELAGESFNDPDIENFFAASEKGTKEIAFFIDEMNVLPGKTYTGVILSLPAPDGRQGRSVVYISSLSFTSDYAYGIDIEYMVFDSQARPLFSLRAPYAKFLPITLDDRHQVLIMMRGLDRRDSSRQWEPEWNAEGNFPYYPDGAQITLSLSYETFLMLLQMRQGLPGLQTPDLLAASGLAAAAGYIPEVFEAEFLNRISVCLFFLPMAVFTIIIGWRLRARRKPRYLFVPLLPVLPLVFNGMTQIYRVVLNTVGASLILALGFSAALAVFIVFMVLALIFSLVLLAAQRG